MIIVAGILPAACDSNVSSSEASPSAAPVTCGQPLAVRQPDLCHTISVNGQPYRYSILKAPGSNLQSLIVVDQGGPGNSALAAGGVGHAMAALEIAAPAPGTGVVLVEEPWVTRPEQAGACAKAASGYLDAMLGGHQARDVITAMKTECDHLEFGWSAGRYRDVLAAISANHQAPIRQFAGSSFAAVRLAWLSSDPRFKISRAILSNPLLPELPFDEVLWHQASAIAQLGPSNVQPSMKLSAGQLLAAAASQLSNAASSSSPTAAKLNLDQIRSMANTYLGRYGDGKLSPSRLAYYQELCNAGFMPSQPSSWDGGRDDPYGFLTAVHGGCPGQPPQRPQVLGSGIDLCISISKNDRVVPFLEAEKLLAKRQFYVIEGPHSAGPSSECRDFLTKVEPSNGKS